MKKVNFSLRKPCISFCTTLNFKLFFIIIITGVIGMPVNVAAGRRSGEPIGGKNTFFFLVGGFMPLDRGKQNGLG